MSKLRSFFKLPFFRNYKVLAFIWMTAAFIAGYSKYINDTFNNYRIFKGVFWHTLGQLPIYQPFPDEYYDINLYGITFSALIAPFAIMPNWAGVVLWVLFNAFALHLAIKLLPLERWQFAVVIWCCAHELYEAALMQQFNIGVAAVIVLAFVAMERKQEFWAACVIMLGTLTKVYGIVGLAFLPFSKNRVRFFLWLAVWGVVFFVLPMLYSSCDFVVGQYGEWFSILGYKNSLNADALYQNVSLLGFVRRNIGATDYSDMYIIACGLVLFALPYLRFKQYENRRFRLLILASTLLFTVLFSTGTESSGYIIAMVGVAVWYVSTPTKTKTLNLFLLFFALILTSFSSTDLFPYAIRKAVIVPYALKALPCILVWFKICYELFFVDFSETGVESKLVAKHYERVDVVLPCYNPHDGWVSVIVDTHKRFSEALGDRSLRFIIVNDGSSRGYDEHSVRELISKLPNTIMIDNKINQGKGNSIRTGVAASDSDCILYTDIDFPYEVDSMLKVVENMEVGYDIVIATRNETYYRELSLRRKIISRLVKVLNKVVLGLHHSDTQGGLKGINKIGREYLLRTRIKRFLFDTEFIYLTSKCEEVSIHEMPTNLRSGVILPNIRIKVLIREMINFIQVSLRR